MMVHTNVKWYSASGWCSLFLHCILWWNSWYFPLVSFNKTINSPVVLSFCLPCMAVMAPWNHWYCPPGIFRWQHQQCQHRPSCPTYSLCCGYPSSCCQCCVQETQSETRLKATWSWQMVKIWFLVFFKLQCAGMMCVQSSSVECAFARLCMARARVEYI